MAGSIGAPALAASLLLAPALSSVLLAPYVRASGAASVPALLAYRFASPAAGALAAVTAAICGTLFAAAQLQVAARVMAPILPGAAGALAIGILALAPAALGGLRALLRVIAILFAFALTAYLAPVAWLSILVAKNPVPILAYGSAAPAGLAQAAGVRVEGVGALAGSPLSAAALAAFLAFGFAFAPFLTAFLPAAQSPRAAQHANGWSILLIALAVSSAPALGAYAGIALEAAFEAIAVADLPQRAGFLADSFLAQSISVCGEGPNSAAAIAARCGGRAPALADLALSAEAVTIGLPAIAGLPAIYGALMIAAIAAAAIGATSAALFSVAGVIAAGASAEPGRHGEASGRRLFAGRIAAVATLAVALFVSRSAAFDPVRLMVAAATVGAVGLAPPALAAIWSDRANRYGCVASMLFAPVAFAFLRHMRLYGVDFRAASGDEFQVRIPGTGGLPVEIAEAMLVAALVAAVLYGVSLLTGGNPDRDRRDRVRLPDAPQAVPDPSA
jgi:Na+(H+)/acetate symporter ActP